MPTPNSPPRSTGALTRRLQSWSLLTLVGFAAGCGGYYGDDYGYGYDGTPGYDSGLGGKDPMHPHDATPVKDGSSPTKPGDTSPTPARGGFVVVTGDDADDLYHCEGSQCAGLFPSLFREALSRSRSGGKGILAIGVNSGQALAAFNSWNDPSQGGPGAPVTHARSSEDIARADFTRYAFVYLPSAALHTVGGLSLKQIRELNLRQPDLVRFVNDKGGSLLALTQAEVEGGWGFLPLPLETADISFDAAEPTAELQLFAPRLTSVELSHKSFHNVFTGPSGYSGLHVLAYNNEVYNPHTGKPVMLGGLSVVLTSENCSDGRDNDGDGRVDGKDPDCQVCGNGVVDPGEQCDDGNVKPGDGCSAQCNRENRAPEATCRDISVCTDPGVCVATRLTGMATAKDADGDTVTWDEHPLGPYAPGEYGVCVTVSDGQAQDSCWSQVKVSDCEPPVLACPSDFKVECTGQGRARVSPPEARATDNCGPAPVAGPEAASLPLGSHVLTYSSQDASGNTSTCSPTVTVVDTLPPSIACPEPIVAECSGLNSAYVTPGTASADDTCAAATVSGPLGDWYALGTNPVKYSARDTSGNEAFCTSTIQVVDTKSPQVTLTPPEPLWPVDQRYRVVHLEDCIVVHDQCSGGLTQTGAQAAISCVSSDEAPSGTEPDVVFVDATTVKVRVDRAAEGDGRVYSLAFEVKDPSGNLTRGVCPVGVPLDKTASVTDSGEQWRTCRTGASASEWKPVAAVR